MSFSSKKVFTFFPEFKNEHLFKDVYWFGERMRQLGAEHVVACETKGLDCQTLLLPERRRFKFLGFMQLRPHLSKGDCVVLFHNTITTLLILVYIRLLGVFSSTAVKCIIKSDQSSTSLIEKRFSTKILINFNLLLSDLYFFESNSQAELFWKWLVLKKKPFLFINSPKDYGDFSASEHQESKIVIVARHGAPQKNSFQVLKAIEEFLRQGKLVGTEISFIGSATPEFKAQLDKVCERYGNVVYLGNIVDREEYQKILSEHRYLMNFTNWEGLPLSVIEALLCDLTVVGYNHLPFLDDLRNIGMPCQKFETISEFLTWFSEQDAGGFKIDHGASSSMLNYLLDQEKAVDGAFVECLA